MTSVETPSGPRSVSPTNDESLKASSPPPTRAARSGKRDDHDDDPGDRRAANESPPRRQLHVAEARHQRREPGQADGEQYRRIPNGQERSRSGAQRPRQRLRPSRHHRPRVRWRRAHPMWNTDAPEMRWESAEMTAQATVYVPSLMPAGSGRLIVSPTTVGSSATTSPASSSTRTEPPDSETSSENRSVTPDGASGTTAPSAGTTSSNSAWALTVPFAARSPPITTRSPTSRKRVTRDDMRRPWVREGSYGSVDPTSRRRDSEQAPAHGRGRRGGRFSCTCSAATAARAPGAMPRRRRMPSR